MCGLEFVPADLMVSTHLKSRRCLLVIRKAWHLYIHDGRGIFVRWTDVREVCVQVPSLEFALRMILLAISYSEWSIVQKCTWRDVLGWCQVRMNRDLEILRLNLVFVGHANALIRIVLVEGLLCLIYVESCEFILSTQLTTRVALLNHTVQLETTTIETWGVTTDHQVPWRLEGVDHVVHLMVLHSDRILHI